MCPEKGIRLMFCLKCGKEIEDSTVFCPFCGGKQPKASWLKTEQASFTPEKATPVESTGPVPETERENASREASAIPGPAAPEPDGATAQRIEAGAGVIGLILLIPFSIRLVSPLLDLVFRLLSIIPFFGSSSQDVFLEILGGVLGVFRVMSLVIILLFSIALFVALIVLLVRRAKPDDNGNARGVIMPCIAMAVSFLVFLSALLALIDVLPVLRTLFMLIALVFGLDLAARVFILHTALNGTFHPLRDLREIQVVPVYDGVPSAFDGKTIQLFGRLLLYTLLALLTFGIALPWLEVSFLKWKTSHTVIDGKRLSFNGTGGQLFIRRIKWTYLTFVTFFVYGFLFVRNAYLSWVLSHTTYEGAEDEADRLNSNIYRNSAFHGTGPDDYGQHTFLTWVPSLTVLFFPFVAAFTYKAYHKWEKRNMTVRNDRYTFDGGALGLLGNNLLCLLVCLIPLSVLGVVVFLLGSFGTASLATLVLMAIFVLLCGVGTLFAFSWSCCRMFRYLTSHTHVDANSL